MRVWGYEGVYSACTLLMCSGDVLLLSCCCPAAVRFGVCVTVQVCSTVCYCFHLLICSFVHLFICSFVFQVCSEHHALFYTPVSVCLHMCINLFDVSVGWFIRVMFGQCSGAVYICSSSFFESSVLVLQLLRSWPLQLCHFEWFGVRLFGGLAVSLPIRATRGRC